MTEIRGNIHLMQAQKCQQAQCHYKKGEVIKTDNKMTIKWRGPYMIVDSRPEYNYRKQALKNGNRLCALCAIMNWKMITVQQLIRLTLISLKA